MPSAAFPKLASLSPSDDRYPRPPSSQDPPVSTSPISDDRALELGLWITEMVGRTFWEGNRRYYQRAAIDCEDLVGHLRMYILTERYLVTVAKNPVYYTEKTYRASLYVACRKACLAHYRKHVVALKRGIGLRDGASVSLDEEREGGYCLQVADDRTEAAEAMVHAMGLTGECWMDRALAFFASGGTANEFVGAMPSRASDPCFNEDAKRSMMARLRQHLTGPRFIRPSPHVRSR